MRVEIKEILVALVIFLLLIGARLYVDRTVVTDEAVVIEKYIAVDGLGELANYIKLSTGNTVQVAGKLYGDLEEGTSVTIRKTYVLGICCRTAVLLNEHAE